MIVFFFAAVQPLLANVSQILDCGIVLRELAEVPGVMVFVHCVGPTDLYFSRLSNGANALLISVLYYLDYTVLSQFASIFSVQETGQENVIVC